MQQPDLPLFLLDNMLNPKIAEALRLVGYNIRSVEEVFGNRLGGVKDPEIIEWCAEKALSGSLLTLRLSDDTSNRQSSAGSP